MLFKFYVHVILISFLIMLLSSCWNNNHGSHNLQNCLDSISDKISLDTSLTRKTSDIPRHVYTNWLVNSGWSNSNPDLRITRSEIIKNLKDCSIDKILIGSKDEIWFVIAEEISITNHEIIAIGKIEDKIKTNWKIDLYKDVKILNIQNGWTTVMIKINLID